MVDRKYIGMRRNTIFCQPECAIMVDAFHDALLVLRNECCVINQSTDLFVVV